MRAGLKPELCHIVGQLAQVCRLEGIMDELKRERARRGARFGLSGVIFEAGRWRGKTRWKRTRSGTRFRLLGVIFEMGGWRGQLVEHLVTVLIFKLVVCVVSY